MHGAAGHHYGFTSDYATHAKVLAEYKGMRPVIALSKPIDVSELRAVLAPEAV
jgi:hypothetical protein